MRINMQLPGWAYVAASEKLSRAWGSANPQSAVNHIVSVAGLCATTITRDGATVRRV